MQSGSYTKTNHNCSLLLQTIGDMTFVDVLNDQKKYPIMKLGHVFIVRGFKRSHLSTGGPLTVDDAKS